ncbi:UNVERIFIED_CONTAM: hypothetical protein FKN15_068227 [Acipenser sinensis]
MEPTGIHPLLVEVGGASSPPTAVKVEPAGIHPLLVEVGGASSPPTTMKVEVAEVEAMGLMLATQREAVAVLAPCAVAAGLVRAVLPSAAKTAAAGEHQHPALLPPKKFQGVKPVAPPLLALGAEAVEVGAACGLLAMKVGAACSLLAMEVGAVCSLPLLQGTGAALPLLQGTGAALPFLQGTVVVVGEVIPADIHTLLVDTGTAGILSLLVDMGTAGIVPLLVEVEPAGILPFGL